MIEARYAHSSVVLGKACYVIGGYKTTGRQIVDNYIEVLGQMNHDLAEHAHLNIDKGWRVLNLPKNPPLLAPLICARPTSNSILIMGHDYGRRHNSHVASKVLQDGDLKDLAVCGWVSFHSLSDTVYEDIDGRIYSIVYAAKNIHGHAIEEEWLMSVPADFKDQIYHANIDEAAGQVYVDIVSEN